MKLPLANLLLLTTIGCTEVNDKNPVPESPNQDGISALEEVLKTCNQTTETIEIAIATGTQVCQSNNGEPSCESNDLTIEQTPNGCTINNNNNTQLSSGLETITCTTLISTATIDHGRTGEICTIEATERSDIFTDLARQCIRTKEQIEKTANSYCDKLPILQVISQAPKVIQEILNTYTEDPSAFKITRDNDNRITSLELEHLSPQNIYTYAKITIKYAPNGNILDLNITYETRRNGLGTYPIDNPFQVTLGCNPETLTCYEKSQRPTLTNGQMTPEDAGNLAIRIILDNLKRAIQTI